MMLTSENSQTKNLLMWYRKSQSELRTLLDEADKVGKGDILREKWKQDVEDR